MGFADKIADTVAGKVADIGTEGAKAYIKSEAAPVILAAKAVKTGLKAELKTLRKQLIGTFGLSADFPDQEIQAVKDLKDGVLGAYQNFMQYGITSVLKRPLEIIRDVMDFSQDILKKKRSGLNEEYDDAKRYRILVEQRDGQTPIPSVSGLAAVPVPEELSGSESKESKLGLLKKNNKKSTKMDTAPSDETTKEQAKSGKTVEVPATKKVPSSQEALSAEMMRQQMMREKMIQEQMQRQMLAGMYNNPGYNLPLYNPYMGSGGIIYRGGGKKKSNGYSDDMSELITMLVSHKIWMFNKADEISNTNINKKIVEPLLKKKVKPVKKTKKNKSKQKRERKGTRRKPKSRR